MENPSLPHYHGEEPAHTEVVRQMLGITIYKWRWQREIMFLP